MVAPLLLAARGRAVRIAVRAVAGVSAFALLIGLGVLLLAVGVVAGNGTSSAAVNSGIGCAYDAPTADTAAPASAPAGGVSFDAEQRANAAVIVAVGRQLGVDVVGLQAALITALQESGLRNLDHGSADSVGLFQQRPSQGWGTIAEIMQPDHAATRFYQALTAISGYTQLPATVLAQAVQRSAFPDAYAKWTAAADTLLGDPTIGQAQCVVAGTVATFGTGTSQIQLPRGNPRSVDQAIAWARAQAVSGSLDWYRACLSFVAQAYGWGFSGTYFAVDQYTSVIPVSLHHDLDRNPPPGALLFWRTASRAGHVALYLGDGTIASNDIVTNGAISIVPAGAIESQWGATYLGWSPPYFPGGG